MVNYTAPLIYNPQYIDPASIYYSKMTPSITGNLFYLTYRLFSILLNNWSEILINSVIIYVTIGSMLLWMFYIYNTLIKIFCEPNSKSKKIALDALSDEDSETDEVLDEDDDGSYVDRTDSDIDSCSCDEDNLSDENIVMNIDDSSEERYQVIIVRGIPGAGKYSYVMSNERNKNRKFVICYYNDFFYRNPESTFQFDAKKLPQAENYSMNQYINALREGIRTIYVLGNFSETWMYQNYVQLAERENYDINIVEINCPDLDHVRHFNKRSFHNVPLQKSIALWNSWEEELEYPYTVVQPYTEDFDGSCTLTTGNIISGDIDYSIGDYFVNGDSQPDTFLREGDYVYDENPMYVITERLVKRIVKNMTRY